MTKIYVGDSNTARWVKKIYAGVGGVAAEVQKVYVGVNDTAQLIYSTNWRDFYQQVEYIQGTGEQYINCGSVLYFPDSPPIMTVDFQMTSASSSSTKYFVGTTKGTDNRFGVGISSSNNFIFGLGKGFHNRSANTTRHTVVIDSVTHKITQNGTNRAATSGTYTTPTDANWLGVLGAMNTSDELGFGKVKIYHIKLEFFIAQAIWQTAHDYYPVYRKSDGEPGLYDIITGNFYANSGTGTIIVGNDITTVL